MHQFSLCRHILRKCYCHSYSVFSRVYKKAMKAIMYERGFLQIYYGYFLFVARLIMILTELNQKSSSAVVLQRNFSFYFSPFFIFIFELFSCPQHYTFLLFSRLNNHILNFNLNCYGDIYK